MPLYQIKSRWTGAVLLEGDFATMALCVSAARGADLSGADLRGAYLYGADLRGADLRGADLSGADLSDAYLRGADLSGASLSGADLSGADLRGAYLYGANLCRADLYGAYLSGADLYGAIIRDNVTLNRPPLRRAIRADGYDFFLWDTSAGWRVTAGCRFFSMDEAWRHWETTRGDSDPLGAESLDILTMFELAIEREGAANA